MYTPMTVRLLSYQIPEWPASGQAQFEPMHEIVINLSMVKYLSPVYQHNSKDLVPDVAQVRFIDDDSCYIEWRWPSNSRSQLKAGENS